MTALTRQGAVADVLEQMEVEEISAILRLTRGDEVSPAQCQRIRAACRAALRPTITWAQPAPGLHSIEHNGRLLRVFSELAGLAAARAAMARPGQRVARAADFVEPGARFADVAMRAALRRAAAFMVDVSPPLSIAVDSIRVLDDFVVFSPRGAVDIVIE